MSRNLILDPVEVTFGEIREAAHRIRGVARATPLLGSARIDAQCGATVLLKAECLQRTGSFKFRGAYNRLAALSLAEREAGVVAWSSGNHAQGIAAAAAMLGLTATIVMPRDTPEIKLVNTREYGAEVVLYDRFRESREDIARVLADDRGAVLVPSYDDPYVIAGQGTVGLELAEQAAAQDQRLDTVLVCCGGGGLTAGIAVALEALSPATRIYTVEPAGLDDYARSLASGRRLSNDGTARSICDALLAPEPGTLTFPMNRKRVTAGLVVTDDEVRDAMRVSFEALKLVLEPGGAVALAAALQGKTPLAGQTVGVILSGGNVSAVRFAELLGLSGLGGH